MAKPNYRRIVVFWSFVLVSAYLVYVYPLLRITTWYGWRDAIEWPTALLLWIVVVTGLWLSFTARFTGLKVILVNWLGVGFIFFSLCVIYEIARVMFPTDDHQSAIWIVVAGLLISLFSFGVALTLAHKHVRIKSSKLGRDYRIVQISDVHIGSRSAAFLKQIVKRVNALGPDYVMITGDLLDTSKVGRQELLALQEIVATTLFIIGNHERYVGLNHVLPILEEFGLSILRNDSLHCQDIQFIGIDDDEDPGQVARTLPSIEMHPSKFRVLLYHRPQGWSSAVSAGIELMLSGHTHNGQIYPFNWLVKRQFRRVKGMHREGGSHLYVSPGTGTWGPIMRLGSRNEITCIDLVADTPESG